MRAVSKRMNWPNSGVVTGLLTVLAPWIFGGEVSAATVRIQKVPDEYESVGGHGLALGEAGVAASGGIAATRLNPSLLPLEKQYSVGADYHWPSRGREFYQAGVVDSKTSNVAAGFSYTGFAEDFDPKISEEVADSPVIRRLVLGVGQAFGKLALGANGQFVEAFDNDAAKPKDARVKGTTFGLGASTLASNQVRLGASVENLANRRVRDFSPRTIRVGGAYLFGQGDVTLHLDYRHRDRTVRFESAPILPFALREAGDVDGESGRESDSPQVLNPEQMVIGSFSARVYDYLRILGAYGQSVSDDRKSLSGGLALVNNKFSLSYAASRPYLDSTSAHQAVHLSLSVFL